MGKFRLLLAAFMLSGQAVFAADSGTGFGLSVGLGLPFLAQGGLHFKPAEKLSFYLGYNQLSASSGEAELKLTMPEVGINFHPMGGAFFIGAAVGQEKLDVTATETNGSDQAKIEVTAMTTMAKLGWMWGIANGGFWYGLDFAYIMPSGAKSEITAPGVPTTDPAYQDAVEAADKFGKTSYINFTFARFGWFF